MRETIKNEFFLSENNWIKDFLKKIIDFYLQVFSLFAASNVLNGCFATLTLNLHRL